jgi:hypothetical protein
MEEHNIPRIIGALRMRDGVLTTFENGKSAIYSAALLYAVIPKADKSIKEESNDQD